MVEHITDRHVVSVLRPFVRATAPTLDAPRQSDPVFPARRALPERLPIQDTLATAGEGLLPSAIAAEHCRVTMKAATATLWRFARTLWALGCELDKSPQGRIHHRAVGMLPVIGLAGDYFGERSALNEPQDRQGDGWARTHPQTPSRHPGRCGPGQSAR